MKRPETRYVAVGGVRVAYQILGEGSVDLVYCHGLGCGHVDLIWDLPGTAEFWQRAALFCRPIICDRRGTGASDALPGVTPTLEDWVDDLRAVLDAAGSSQAVIVGELD